MLKFPKVVREHTQGVVENIKWFCWKFRPLSAVKEFENRLRFEKFIAKSLVASFFETQCIYKITSNKCMYLTHHVRQH